MDFQRPPPELMPFGLRALKAIASADGVLSASERDLLATAQRVFGSDEDLDALAPIVRRAERSKPITSPS